ncbi:hypothetical protein D3C87_347790 [compost metagenome]
MAFNKRAHRVNNLLTEKIQMENPFADVDDVLPPIPEHEPRVVRQVLKEGSTAPRDPLSDMLMNIELVNDDQIKASLSSFSLNETKSVSSTLLQTLNETLSSVSTQDAQKPTDDDPLLICGLHWQPYQLTKKIGDYKTHCGGFYYTDGEDLWLPPPLEAPLAVLSGHIKHQAISASSWNHEVSMAPKLDQQALSLYFFWICHNRPLKDDFFKPYLVDLLIIHLRCIAHRVCHYIDSVVLDDLNFILADVSNIKNRVMFFDRTHYKSEEQSQWITMLLEQISRLITIAYPALISPFELDRSLVGEISEKHSLHYRIHQGVRFQKWELFEHLLKGDELKDYPQRELIKPQNKMIYDSALLMFNQQSKHFMQLSLPIQALTSKPVTLDMERDLHLPASSELPITNRLCDVNLLLAKDNQQVSTLLNIMEQMLSKISPKLLSDKPLLSSNHYCAAMLPADFLSPNAKDCYSLSKLIGLNAKRKQARMTLGELCREIFPELSVINPVNNKQIRAKSGSTEIELMTAITAIIRIARSEGLSVSLISKNDLDHATKSTTIHFVMGDQLTSKNTRYDMVIFIRAFYLFGGFGNKVIDYERSAFSGYLKTLIKSGSEPIADEIAVSLSAYLACLCENQHEKMITPHEMELLRQHEKTDIIRIAMILAASIRNPSKKAITSAIAIYQSLNIDLALLKEDCVGDDLMVTAVCKRGSDFILPPKPAKIEQPKQRKRIKSAPVSVPEPEPMLVLDMSLISEVEKDTVRSKQLLHAIFAEEEPASAPVDIAASSVKQPTVTSDEAIAGLSPAISQIYLALRQRASWSQDAMQSLCKGHQQMVGAAMEAINDWAIELCGAPLIDEDDEFVIDEEILAELPG